MAQSMRKKHAFLEDQLKNERKELKGINNKVEERREDLLRANKNNMNLWHKIEELEEMLKNKQGLSREKLSTFITGTDFKGGKKGYFNLKYDSDSLTKMFLVEVN